MTKSVIHITTCVKQTLLRLFKPTLWIYKKHFSAYSSRILNVSSPKTQKTWFSSIFFCRHSSNTHQTVGNYYFLYPLLESTSFLGYSFTDFYRRFLNLVLIIILSDHVKIKIIRISINLTKLYSRALNVIIFFYWTIRCN